MNSALQSITAIPAPFNMIVLFVLIATVGSAFATFIHQIRKYASHRLELDFKRDLLDRGMSADEVERIVRAHGSTVRAPGAVTTGGQCR